MRTITAVMLLLLLVSTALAQPEAETPRQSFEKFIEAVLSETLPDEDRAAQFERYFDFEEWLTGRGGEHTEAEQAAMKSDWFELFQSAEFRDSYREREVRVVEEPKPDLAAGRAELVISMTGEQGDEKFRVMLNVSEDGTWWRWYSIPQIVEAPQARSLEERLRVAEENLRVLLEERQRLEMYEQLLRKEIARMRAEVAEGEAGASPFSTPKSVVTSAWIAIEKGDADALLDCHTTQQVAKTKLEAVQADIDNTRERLMSWEVQQATIDENDDTRAVVPVRVTLRRTGEPDVRTISVRVVRVGDQWKIDEAP